MAMEKKGSLVAFWLIWSRAMPGVIMCGKSHEQMPNEKKPERSVAP